LSESVANVPLVPAVVGQCTVISSYQSFRREAFLFGPFGQQTKDSEPALQGHPGTPMAGLRQKSAFAQPINHSRREIASLKECKTIQKSQIALN
jgi:hypothetical protein